MVRAALRDCARPDVLDTAELLTSELVTNALLHAGTDLTVQVESHDHTVRVAVEDGSPNGPRRGRPDDAALGGRGIPLVETLASAWGWEPLPRGKRVWFEVRDN
jgi:anti-sigma regulatory factor (Ser/Thr protein kinase)